MLACVPSKTIVEQRGRQVKPGRRDEGETTNKSWRSPNIDNIDINNIELNHQLLTTFSFKGLILLKWLLLLFCYNIPLMLHISIEKLQNPFSQFQGAVVPKNRLKIFLLARISSTRRALATREITQFPPWWQCALTLIIRWGGSLSGSQSKEVLWIFKICKYLTQYTYSTLFWRRFC